MLEPLNYAAHSLGAQSDTGERSNLLAAESLAKIEPKDSAVAVGVGSALAAQVFVDLRQENVESDGLFAAFGSRSSLGLYVVCRNVLCGTARGLTAAVFEIVVGCVRGRLLQVAKDRIRPLDRKLAQKIAPALPKLEVRCLDQIVNGSPRGITPNRSGARDHEAQRPSDARDELRPSFFIGSGAEAHHVFQG